MIQGGGKEDVEPVVEDLTVENSIMEGVEQREHEKWSNKVEEFMWRRS